MPAPCLHAHVYRLPACLPVEQWCLHFCFSLAMARCFLEASLLRLDPWRRLARPPVPHCPPLSAPADASRAVPAAQTVLAEAVEEFIHQGAAPAEHMIRNLVACELAYINTSHPQFIGGNRAIAQVRMKCKRHKLFWHLVCGRAHVRWVAAFPCLCLGAPLGGHGVAYAVSSQAQTPVCSVTCMWPAPPGMHLLAF